MFPTFDDGIPIGVVVVVVVVVVILTLTGHLSERTGVF